MTRSDIITVLATRINVTQKQATEIINLVFNGFSETLKNNGRIEIRGFGSLSVRKYKAYAGRNPKTGESTAVEPKRLPFFKVGRELRVRVNGG
jgi:integration host factor subunit beta